MFKKILNIALISIFTSIFCSAFYAQRGNKTTFINAKVNNYALKLYADKLDFQATLVDLPGAKLAGSSWHLSYEVYFVGETDFNEAIQNISKVEKVGNGVIKRTGDPTKQDFPKKSLLTKGEFTKKSLGEISDRIVEKKGFDFKKIVADELRTEIAKIIIFYTVKVYDAKLKKNVYRSGLFIQSPFEVEKDIKQAKSELFLSFYITDEGELFASSRARDKSDTSW